MDVDAIPARLVPRRFIRDRDGLDGCREVGIEEAGVGEPSGSAPASAARTYRRCYHQRPSAWRHVDPAALTRANLEPTLSVLAEQGQQSVVAVLADAEARLGGSPGG